MNTLVGEISTAAVEQSKAILQIGHSVQEMGRLTQENAPLVAQTSASSRSLRKQAK